MSMRGPVVFLLLASLAASPVAAQTQTTYPEKVEEHCKEDYFRHCAPYALGTVELRRCMEANGKALAKKCQQALLDAGLVNMSRIRRGG